MNNPPPEAVGSRATSSSGNERSPRDSRRINSQQQISQIEKSVTHLLIATKQLLETLTLWSRGSATEKEVSDVYVRLGYEFNIACRAFAAIGVETKDLGPVPDLLRTILEETLSNDANQTNLDRYLPRIRDIIVGLLQGLKKKQQKLRQRLPRDSSSSSSPSEARQNSGSFDGASSQQSARSSVVARQDSGNYPAPEGSGLPPRGSSNLSGRTSPTRNEGPTYVGARRALSGAGQGERSGPVYTPAESSTSSLVPEHPLPMPQVHEENISHRSVVSPPPIPSDPSSDYLQPHQQDAIAKLQRGGELERRASRRFSAYQIQKHLGTNSSGIPMVPPTQNSPIPNRGREARESMNAVRVRGGGGAPSRETSKSTGFDDDASSIERKPRANNKTFYEPSQGSDGPIYELADDESLKAQSGTAKESIDKPTLLDLTTPSVVERRERQDLTDSGVSVGSKDSGQVSLEGTQPRSPAKTAPHDAPASGQTDGSSEPKDLTLFLQYKTKIKKFILAGGYEELSIARLQLAFIEKFAWNTHSNGTDLPEIYIQDPMSGVRHELEDLSDVKNHSVLALNIDTLDEVKKHVDESMGGLTRIVEGVRAAVDSQASTLQRMTTKQDEFSKEINRVASPSAKPLNRISGASFASDRTSMRSKIDKNDQLGEVQKLRRDLAVMRQTYTTLVTEVESTMANIHAKAAALKNAPSDGASVGGNSGRAYVNAGKKSLSEESEKIINRVDDLQDVVEDLRKDVVARGVRPLPRQLDTVRREIAMATNDLKKMQEFIKKEKPQWTEIWKNELQVVCDDQNLLTVQEELAADLEDDLAKANETFSLVEEATKAQSVQNATGATSRSTSRTLAMNGSEVDPQKAKDGVLGEVRALQPNHESRIEAIERAEKLRERERANRSDGEFKKELGNFVGEGKLKKSGGVEEAERQRKIKDERSRKETWDRMNARAAGIEPQHKVASLPADADATEVPQKLDIPSHATTQGDIASPGPDDFVEAREEIVVNGDGGQNGTM